MATTNLGLQTINQGDYVSPDPINSNFEALDALGLDYVVAQGTSGIWRYQRWRSGKYECWGRYSQQSATANVGDGVGMFQAGYPITFAEAPVVSVTARLDGVPRVHVCYVEHGTSSAQWYLEGMGASAADLECSLHVVGRVS